MYVGTCVWKVQEQDHEQFVLFDPKLKIIDSIMVSTYEIKKLISPLTFKCTGR